MVFLLFPLILSAEVTIPRRIITFWDSKISKMPADSLVHRMLEMPLNHLGMDVEYYDVHDPLPDLTHRHDVRGVLLCFQEQTRMKDPKAFIEWAVKAIEQGKKIVIMRNGGFFIDTEGNYTPGSVQNRLYERLGIIHTQTYIDYPFDYQILSQDNEFFPFEREYPKMLPSFYRTKAYDPKVTSYLKVGIPGKPETEADLIVIGPRGAYISDYYANSYLFSTDPRSQQWFMDPFRFFEVVFELEHLPIPDTTTLAGRRIFYYTLHGDNWNTPTSLEEYQGKGLYCSEVILEKIVKPNPDLPVTVSVVAADADPKWVARPRSQEIVRAYFELPQVEAASHTYSHPFEWGFFKTGGPEKEIYYLNNYPYGSWQNSFLSWFRAQYYSSLKKVEREKLSEGNVPGESDIGLRWKYVIPRAYANEPFNLNKEIDGSISFLNTFAPSWNQIKILIWSGDGRPWEVPVSMCYAKGIKQLGGGFVRFDEEFPSYLFVYPLGRKPGSLIQIYSSTNAENSYTEGWSNYFYGFQYLPATLKNTETPRRIKPILLYYHSYSGEFLSSVNAVLKNIEYIKAQNPISIRTTRFCELAEGFYSIEIEPIGPSQWKLRNRKGLQTIRFDHIKNLTVDFSSSKGIVGCKEYQGSLYVYLDASVKEPILTLSDTTNTTTPYLLDSSWEIWNLKGGEDSFEFSAQGWGTLIMQWKVMPDSHYSIQTSPIPSHSELEAKEGILSVELDLPNDKEMTIKMVKRTK